MIKTSITYNLNGVLFFYQFITKNKLRYQMFDVVTAVQSSSFMCRRFNCFYAHRVESDYRWQQTTTCQIS